MPKKTTLTFFFDECVGRNLPVAVYRLPHTTTVHVVAQKNESKRGNSIKAEEPGFLFSPFVNNKKTKPVLIHPDVFCEAKNLSLHFFDNAPIGKNSASPFHDDLLKASTRKEFENLVNNIKKEITHKRFSKIVAARVAFKKRSKGFDTVQLFRDLCKEYPNAFVSVVFTPAYGLWVGATPEVLLNVKGTTLHTFSLAGTKTKATRKWDVKEYEEQKLVTVSINKTLQKISNEVFTTAPKTVKAGNLFHLLTTFTVPNFDKKDWQRVAKVLHPTPALAGVPKARAVKFITTNEKSPRNFYSGYLGPINLHSQINLFVNIRCMRVLESKLALYTGCGVTQDSNAASEWLETEAKTQTLLRVLNKLK